MRENPSTLRWLALGVFLTYLFTSSGGFESGDTYLRWETARSWLEGRGGALPPELGWNGGAVLPDGRIYAFFAPLQSVLMVPFLLAARIVPAGGIDPTVIETFVVSLGLFPLVSTAVIVLLFLSLRLLGCEPRAALAAVLAIAVGSLFWHYARMGQEENLVALGFALWLYGAARLAADRPFPAVFLGLGAVVALATRWAAAPQLVVLFAATLILFARFRPRLRWADLALGALAVLAGVSLLLLYNHLRFGDWRQTGYGIWYAHEKLTMFRLEGYGGHFAALLVSPYRGLLVYSPVVLAAVAGAFTLRPGTPRLLAWTGLSVLLAALLFYSSFRFWSGGHSWGPRFLASSHALLAPALAAFFARFPRSALVIPLFATLQIFSTVLPASTEEYVWFNIDRSNPGFCNEWRFECTAISQRIPRGVSAFANTVRSDPGVRLRNRPLVAPDVVLQTSDYRTLYWWPVRIAFRLGLIPAWAALLACLAGLSTALAALARAWRGSA